MKRLLFLMLLLLCMLCAAQAESLPDFTYDVLADGTVCITGCRSAAEHLVIPETLDGRPVTAIRHVYDFPCSSVSLPASVLYMEDNPFFLSRLSAIEVDAANPVFYCKNGLLINRLEKRVVCCAAESGSTSCVVPEGVQAIGDYAFYGCSTLQNLILPSSLREIGHFSFAMCFDLNSVNLPQGLVSIGDFAFAGCHGVAGYHLPASLSQIGCCAFDGLSMQCFTLPADHPALMLENGVLYNKITGVLISCPRSIADTVFHVPEGTTALGGGAFTTCRSLTAVTLPEGLTEIGEMAFSYCSSLNSVAFPSTLSTIGTGAFLSCLSLKELALPEGVQTIGPQAFMACGNMTSLLLPASVSFIAENAFYNCDALTLAVKNGSYAHLWAKQNSFPFRLIP